MLHGGQVGGTEPVCKQIQCASGGQEVVSSTGPAGGRISSGGGFAEYSPMPAYQVDVVKKYLGNDTAMQFAGGRGKDCSK